MASYRYVEPERYVWDERSCGYRKVEYDWVILPDLAPRHPGDLSSPRNPSPCQLLLVPVDHSATQRLTRGRSNVPTSRSHSLPQIVLRPPDVGHLHSNHLSNGDRRPTVRFSLEDEFREIEGRGLSDVTDHIVVTETRTVALDTHDVASDDYKDDIKSEWLRYNLSPVQEESEGGSSRSTSRTDSRAESRNNSRTETHVEHLDKPRPTFRRSPTPDVDKCLSESELINSDKFSFVSTPTPDIELLGGLSGDGSSGTITPYREDSLTPPQRGLARPPNPIPDPGSDSDTPTPVPYTGVHDVMGEQGEVSTTTTTTTDGVKETHINHDGNDVTTSQGGGDVTKRTHTESRSQDGDLQRTSETETTGQAGNYAVVKRKKVVQRRVVQEGRPVGITSQSQAGSEQHVSQEQVKQQQIEAQQLYIQQQQQIQAQQLQQQQMVQNVETQQKTMEAQQAMEAHQMSESSAQQVQQEYIQQSTCSSA